MWTKKGYYWFWPTAISPTRDQEATATAATDSMFGIARSQRRAGHGVVPQDWAIEVASENDRSLVSFGQGHSGANGDFWMIQWEFMGFNGDFQGDSMGFNVLMFFLKWEHDLSMGFSSGKGGRRWNFDDFPELFHGTIGGKLANHAEFSWDFPGDRLKPMVFINVGLWGKISRPDHDPALHDGWEWTHHLA